MTAITTMMMVMPQTNWPTNCSTPQVTSILCRVAAAVEEADDVTVADTDEVMGGSGCTVEDDVTVVNPGEAAVV